MLFNKKGQGLPLNTIIIAILVIVVLVVIILMFTGQMGNFLRGTAEGNACRSEGGACIVSGVCEAQGGEVVPAVATAQGWCPVAQECCRQKRTP